MKKIIFMLNGATAVCHPVEGGRLAFAIKDAEGTDIARRKIAIPVDGFQRVWPIDGVSAEWAETEDQWLQRIASKDVPPAATDVHIVEDAELPQDRTFRNAWTITGGAVVHDMAKCVEIHKDTLRTLRAPKLAALDVEFMRALESGDTARCSAIATEKQALRDATNDPALADAKTPDELKALVPAVLQ